MIEHIGTHAQVGGRKESGPIMGSLQSEVGWIAPIFLLKTMIKPRIRTNGSLDGYDTKVHNSHCILLIGYLQIILNFSECEPHLFP